MAASANPAAVATALRAEAEANDQAHAAAIESGGYGPEQAPAEVSHRFAAVAQRLAADLIELDHLGAVSLDAWPEAAEFVAYLTGEADQTRALAETLEQQAGQLGEIDDARSRWLSHTAGTRAAAEAYAQSTAEEDAELPASPHRTTSRPLAL